MADVYTPTKDAQPRPNAADPALRAAWAQRDLQAVEQIHPAVTRQWLADGQIVCFTVRSVTREAIDAWLTASEQVSLHWPPDCRYLCLHDCSTVPLTPYIRIRAAASVAVTASILSGRSAVLTMPTFANQIIRLFVTRNLANQNRNVVRQVFFERETAIAWLLQAPRPEEATLER